jgi:hypothetical protein
VHQTRSSFDSSKWPSSVIISEWLFKSQQSAQVSRDLPVDKQQSAAQLSVNNVVADVAASLSTDDPDATISTFAVASMETTYIMPTDLNIISCSSSPPFSNSIISETHVVRQIRSVRRSLTRDALIVLLCALVISKVDYCCSTLAGASRTRLDRLQSVLNAAAQLVFAVRRYDHVTHLLCELHWLRVPERIQFRLCVLAYRCLHSWYCTAVPGSVSPSGG